MEEKILTEEIVVELGLDKVSVITADMLDGYTSIGDNAFYNCTGLNSVTIPNSVTSIGNGAFWYCSSLTSVTIPNSVISIGKKAFSGCSGLTSVTIPNSVTSIGYGAFSGCSSLTTISVEVGNTIYDSRDNCNAIIETASNKLIAGCKNTIIPNSVTSIGHFAFSYCSSLTSVTIGNNVTSIGECAFLCCTSLTFIDIPDSVTSIESDAFYGCNMLTYVTIPNSVTNVGLYAFSYCNFIETKKMDKQGRVIAYKGFNADMTCRYFQYKEGETYKINGEPILCERGFHACLNPLDCFSYYWGEIGEKVVYHEVYLDGVSDVKRDDSKVVAKKITIGREITLSEMAEIASGKNKILIYGK